MRSITSKLSFCAVLIFILTASNICVYGDEPVDPNIPIEAVMRKMQSVYHWLQETDEYHKYLYDSKLEYEDPDKTIFDDPIEIDKNNDRFIRWGYNMGTYNVEPPSYPQDDYYDQYLKSPQNAVDLVKALVNNCVRTYESDYEDYLDDIAKRFIPNGDVEGEASVAFRYPADYIDLDPDDVNESNYADVLEQIEEYLDEMRYPYYDCYYVLVQARDCIGKTTYIDDPNIVVTYGSAGCGIHYSSKFSSASLSSAILRTDLRAFAGRASNPEFFLKLTDEDPNHVICNPVSADGLYHSWAGGNLIAGNLCDSDRIPICNDPICTSDPNESYSWEYDHYHFTLEPIYEEIENPLLNVGPVDSYIFKSMDEKIYAGNGKCKQTSGEVVDGLLVFEPDEFWDPNDDTYKVVIELEEPYDANYVELRVGSWIGEDSGSGYLLSSYGDMYITDAFVISPTSEIEYDPNNTMFGKQMCKFSVVAKEIPEGMAELDYTETVKFKAFFIRYDYEDDPNLTTEYICHNYKSDEVSFTFDVVPNTYNRCCSSSGSTPKPLSISGLPPVMTLQSKAALFNDDYFSDDYEIYFPDIFESYIVQEPDLKFVDIDSIDSIAGGFEVIGTDGMVYRFSSGEGMPGAGWKVEYLCSSVGYMEDATFRELLRYTYNTDRTLNIVYDIDPYNPTDLTHYRQYRYTGGFLSGYTVYAEGDSRDYSITVDSSGNITSIEGEGSSGCSSCSGSGTGMYEYYEGTQKVRSVRYKDDQGEYQTGNEFIYDDSGHLIEKWIGQKSIQAKPAFILEENTVDGRLIQDRYDYLDTVNYRVTRRIYEDGKLIDTVTYTDINENPNSPSGSSSSIKQSVLKTTDESNNDVVRTTVFAPGVSEQTSGLRRVSESVYRNGYVLAERDFEYALDVSNGTVTPADGNTVPVSETLYELFPGSSTAVGSRIISSEDTYGNITTYFYGTGSAPEQVDGMLMPELDGYAEYLDYVYNSRGNQIKIKHYMRNMSTEADTLNYVEHNEYDGWGNLLCTYKTLADVETPLENEKLELTEYIYNGFGDVLYTVHPDGTVTGNDYYSDGSLKSEFTLADPNDVEESNPDLISYKKYSYDNNNRLQYIYEAIDDDLIEYSIDDYVADDWKITQYTYTLDGQKYQQIQYAPESELLITTYHYDNQGRVIQVDKPDGSWTKTIYNGLGRVETTINGYTESQTDVDVLKNSNEYYPDGSLKQTTNADGSVSYRIYDDFGNLWKQYNEVPVDPNNAARTEYSYDSIGNIIEQKHISEDGKVLHDVYKVYDNGQLAADIQFANIYDISFQDTVSPTDANQICHPYYEGNKCTIYKKQYDPENGQWISYTWQLIDNSDSIAELLADDIISDANQPCMVSVTDNLGRQVYSTDFNGNQTTYSYLDNGQLDSVTLPDGTVQQYAYEYGRIAATIIIADPNNPNSVRVKTEPQYNSLGQSIKQTVYEWDTNTSTWSAIQQSRNEYDCLGRTVRQIVMKDPADAGTWDYSTDMVTEHLFDDDNGGRLYKIQKRANNDPNQLYWTRYEYDEIGRRIRTVQTQPELEALDYNGSYGGGIVGSYSETVYGSVSDDTTVGNTYNNAQVAKTIQHQFDNTDIYGSEAYDITNFLHYDSYGRLWKQVADLDGNGAETAADLTTEMQYNSLGRKVKEIAPDGIITTYSYNGLGLIEEIVEDASEGAYTGKDRTTSYTYTRRGNQKTITGSQDNSDQDTIQTTTYSLDKNGNVTEILYPDATTIKYKYTSGNKAYEKEDRAGGKLYYGWGYAGNILWETDDYVTHASLADPNVSNPVITMPASGKFLNTYTYNGASALTEAVKYEASTVVSKIQRQYDGLGLTSEKVWFGAAGPFEVAYTQDQAGSIRTRTIKNGTSEKEVLYRYDGSNRLNSVDIEDDGHTDINLSYLGGNLKKISYQKADAFEIRDFDKLGRINRMGAYTDDEETILDYLYAYDEAGNRSYVKYNHLTSPVWDVYTYDNLRRLTDVSYDSASATPAAADESYLFDLLGNRQSASLAGGDVWSYTVDEENNQYDSVTINSSNKNLSYDNRGNLTTDQNNWDYTYSSQNQLATVKDETNSTVAFYKYDALGRRYKKAVGANSTYFLYDTQGRIIAQYTSTTTNTAPDRWFVQGNGFQPLAMLREPDNTAGLNHLAAFIETWLADTGNGGYNTGYDFDSSGFVDMNDLDIMADLYDFEITHPSAYYYLHDALGSTMGLLADYPEADDWNEFYRYDAWGNIVDGSDIDNPFLWAGYYHDEETNDYYCMNRYYDPTLARWTQNDPYQYIDGLNLYEYVRSKPISAIDPLGLWGSVGGFTPIPEYTSPTTSGATGGYLQSVATSRLNEIADKHSGYEYYKFTGLKSLMDGKLIPTLSSYSPGAFHVLRGSALGRYNTFTNRFFIKTNTSANTIFHETIHAYNDKLTWGDFDQRIDEGMAYGAENLLKNIGLPYLRNIEDELEKSNPDISVLRRSWHHFWHMIDTTVIGAPLEYKVGLSVHSGSVNETDIRRIEKYFGFKIKCRDFAEVYNKISMSKLGPTGSECIKFECTIGSPKSITIAPLKNRIFE